MKQSEIKGLQVVELQENINSFKKKYMNLKMSHVLTPLENPLQLRIMRRTIARLKTELAKRESE